MQIFESLALYHTLGISRRTFVDSYIQQLPTRQPTCTTSSANRRNTIFLHRSISRPVNCGHREQNLTIGMLANLGHVTDDEPTKFARFLPKRESLLDLSLHTPIHILGSCQCLPSKSVKNFRLRPSSKASGFFAFSGGGRQAVLHCAHRATTVI